MDRKLKSIIGYIILAVILIILPKIAPNNYFIQIMNMSIIWAILAMGFNILAGYTGQISLGQAAFYAIGAYTSALLNTKLHLNFWIGLIAAIIVSGLFGLILAIPALKVKGKYLVLLTIGFGEIVRLVLLNWKAVTGGTSGVLGIKAPAIFGYTFNKLNKYYYFALVFCVLLYILQKRLITTRVGRAFIAIREDENAAELSGINLSEYKIKAFVISAIYCGVAGVLYAHMVKYVSPDTFRYDESVMILSMAVIGGIGTFDGPIIGSILLTILPEVLRKIGNFRLVTYGLLLIIVIMFYPGGIIHGINDLKRRLSRLSAGKTAKERQ